MTPDSRTTAASQGFLLCTEDALLPAFITQTSALLRKHRLGLWLVDLKTPRAAFALLQDEGEGLRTDRPLPDTLRVGGTVESARQRLLDQGWVEEGDPEARARPWLGEALERLAPLTVVETLDVAGLSQRLGPDHRVSASGPLVTLRWGSGPAGNELQFGLGLESGVLSLALHPAGGPWEVRSIFPVRSGAAHPAVARGGRP